MTSDWFTGLAAVEVEHVPEVTSQTVNAFTMLAIDGTFTLQALLSISMMPHRTSRPLGITQTMGTARRSEPTQTPLALSNSARRLAQQPRHVAHSHYNDDSQCYFYNEGATQLPAGAGDLARRFYIKPDPAYTTTVITPVVDHQVPAHRRDAEQPCVLQLRARDAGTSTTDDVGGHVPLVTEEYWDNSYAGWPVRFGECSATASTDATQYSGVSAAVTACLALPSTDCAAIYMPPAGQYYLRAPAAFTSGTECTGLRRRLWRAQLPVRAPARLCAPVQLAQRGAHVRRRHQRRGQGVVGCQPTISDLVPNGRRGLLDRDRVQVLRANGLQRLRIQQRSLPSWKQRV